MMAQDAAHARQRGCRQLRANRAATNARHIDRENYEGVETNPIQVSTDPVSTFSIVSIRVLFQRAPPEFRPLAPQTLCARKS
jgi:hypothetical protein